MRKYPKRNSPEFHSKQTEAAPLSQPGKSKKIPPKRDLSKKSLGDYGESLVARWYRQRGYEIEASQWRCNGGEIDLIASKGNELVFCEVKTRRTLDFGGAEIVGFAKQQRVRKSAAMYLTSLDEFVPEIRFDVAVVCNSQIEVVEGAF